MQIHANVSCTFDNLYQNGDPSPAPTLYQRVSDVYKQAVKSLLAFLKEQGWRTIRMIIAPYLVEPCNVLRASLVYPLGWATQFQFFGLNPKSITSEQAQHRPILLLHGNYHNQSAWLALAKELQKTSKAPVYTINLHSGYIDEKDRPLLEAKMEEIKDHYRAHGKADIQVDIVGHSRGAHMAGLFGLEADAWHIVENDDVIFDATKMAWRRDVGNIIRIGSPTIEKELQALPAYMHSKIFEIDAKEDFDVEERSLLDSAQKEEIDCGHLGLLFSPKVHALVIDRLHNCSSPHREMSASREFSVSLSA